jgi:DNA-directed RNA polymerase subunit delta
MTDLKHLSIMEAAEAILRANKDPMTFYELFAKLAEIKELSDAERAELIAKFYADFIISAKFVYMGDDLWDLKSRQSIDLWDKDGAYYREFPEDEEEELEVEEEEEEEEVEEELEEEEEEEAVVYEKDFEHELDEVDEEEVEEDELLVDEVEGFDDDKYNEYMDDYEDMYDE